MDEFLIFGKSVADPFLRIGSINEPLLLMVEFCQIQGPRPLFVHPAGVHLPHLLEEISVWLMSSENMHGNFSSLYNQQLGVHILVQYATMLDITARALQRPFAIALILPDEPSAELVLEFQQISTEALVQLLSCNRTFLHSVVNFAAQIVENSEMRNFQSYYSTAGNAQQIVILSNKIKGIVQQTKPWYDRLMATIYGRIEGGNPPNNGQGNGCGRCGCECDEGEFRKFIQILGRKQMAPLTNLMDMAPCAGRNFCDLLERVYVKCAGNGKEAAEGLMFSGKLAVARSLFGANSQKDPQEECSPSSSSSLDTMAMAMGHHPHFALVGAENALKSLSFRLTRILFPLLAGEKICILASQQRSIVGIDLMDKLNRLRVAKRAEKIEWKFNNRTNMELGENQVEGISCGRDKSLEWTDQVGAQHDFVVVDLNNHRIRCRPYSGQFLANLAGTRNFPSDHALMDFVAAIVADIFQLVLLAKSISPESVVRHFALSKADQMIFYNFLVEFNLTKYIRLKTKAREIQAEMPFGIQKF